MRLTAIRTDPRPVAVARVGLGLATVLNSVEAFEILARIADGKLAAPVFEGTTTPTVQWLIALLVVAIAAAVAIVLGWQTERAAIVSVALTAAALLWDQQTYSSHRWLALLLLTYLIFAKAGTAWSIRSIPGLPTVPWWPQLLMMTQLSIVYFFSALSKMNPYFISGGPLASWVWIELPWQFYTLAAVMTVIVEFVVAIALWFRSVRRVAVLLGFGLHLSIVVLMTDETLALIAFALTCLSLYPLFLFRPNFTDPRIKVAARIPAATE